MKKNDLIHKTFRFIHNIPYNFIEEIWSDNPMLVVHLRAKFTGFCRSEGYPSANAILKFYSSLDDSNSEKFCAYASTWAQQH